MIKPLCEVCGREVDYVREERFNNLRSFKYTSRCHGMEKSFTIAFMDFSMARNPGALWNYIEERLSFRKGETCT